MPKKRSATPTGARASQRRQVDEADSAAEQHSSPSKAGDAPVPVIARQKLVPLPSELASPPPVAVPTLIWFLFFSGLHAGAHVAHWNEWLSYGLAVPIWSLCTFAVFTAMHDACHGAIATKKSGFGWLNDAVGWIATWVCFCGPFSFFKQIHLEHHKYTNVPDFDPDLWASGIRSDGSMAPRWHIPLRCLTLMLHYYKTVLTSLPARIKRSPSPMAMYIGVVIAVFPVFCYVGHLIPFSSPTVCAFWRYCFWCLTVPQTIGSGILGFTFDFLPHRPSVDQNVFHATALISLTGNGQPKATTATSTPPQHEEASAMPTSSTPSSTGTYVTTPLTPLLAYQNYHVVHHLYPFVPFYQYSRVWYAMETKLREKGVRIQPLF